MEGQIMSNYVTLQGFASSDVELDTKESGLLIGKFRMGSTHRVQDPVTKAWSDGPTNWFRVNLFRSLANNVAASVHKGDHIVVSGKLRIKTWLRLDGSQGMAVEIDAETVGNDLKFGTCTYHRNASPRINGQGQYAQGQSDGVSSATPPVPSVAPEFHGEGEQMPPLQDTNSMDADDMLDDPDATDDAGSKTDPGEANSNQVDAGDGLVADLSTGELVDSVQPPY
ncbi:single-stranded DNA-binding protein [Arthrobacter alpinus]|uniref:single-stranded DNA-binding protein n=1 Tax=Arthrobacter alpinus TaxID=656366 RepID=UPI0009E96BB1|nr:single-stranded DNA-binding protein [Arthrobacter alpinus]